jgi:hypothetical protein
VLLAIIMVASASTVTDLTSRLSNYADHPFGSSMINLVSVNMKTGGSLNELKQLL